MSLMWRFNWGLLFWHAVSITSFSICSWEHTAQNRPYHLATNCVTKDPISEVSNEFDYALKQAGFFCVQKILLVFGTARRVSGILSSGSGSSSLTCRDYDRLLCVWFLDQQPLTLESLVSLTQPSAAQFSILSSSSSSGAFHCCICSSLLLQYAIAWYW